METEENIEEALEPEKGESKETSELSMEELQDKLEYWKTHSRKNESEAKRLREAAEKWEEHLASQKTAEEKLSEELNLAKKELEEVRRENLIVSVSSKYNIPSEATKYIVGSSAEEIEQSAIELSELISSKEEKQKPAPNPLQGRDRQQITTEGSALQQALRNQLRNKN